MNTLFVAIMFACVTDTCNFITTEREVYASYDACVSDVMTLQQKFAARVGDKGVISGVCFPIKLGSA
jgi:hypothetical protein